MTKQRRNYARCSAWLWLLPRRGVDPTSLPACLSSGAERRGRLAARLLALNWNKVTQQWPMVSFFIVKTRALSLHVLNPDAAAPPHHFEPLKQIKSKGDQKFGIFWSQVVIISEIILLCSGQKTGHSVHCECEISPRAQRDAECQMAVDASSYRSAVNSNSNSAARLGTFWDSTVTVRVWRCGFV